MSNNSNTKINWTFVVIGIVCLVNMYWAFSGKWGLRPKEEPEPVLGFICLIAGIFFLSYAFSKDSK
jgi:hypothetical protein